MGYGTAIPPFVVDGLFARVDDALKKKVALFQLVVEEVVGLREKEIFHPVRAMTCARITLVPVNSQQRPLLFWSLMPELFTLWLNHVSGVAACSLLAVSF